MPNNLSEQIYDILYKKSRVDGIRLINEDEWPIDELEEFINQILLDQKKRILEEVIGKDEIVDKKDIYYRLANATDDAILLKGMVFARNELRQEMRKKLEKI